MVIENLLNSLEGCEEGRGELYKDDTSEFWAHRLTSTVEYRPRQFEYHPSIPERMVVGTLEGQVIVTDVYRDVAVSVLDDQLLAGSGGAILGLCWLRTHTSKFVAGASSGRISLCDIGENGTPEILHTYLHQGKITSVHLNCTDEYLLSSGYSDYANITDVETGQLINKFDEIHKGHINISRFSNLNPSIFATCSFDCTAKMWDMRDPNCLQRPIYTCKSDSGYVMLCFSPDDVFLLTSAVDNDVTQYLAVDGTKHLKLNLPSTKKDDNFTRAYYTADSQHILSGSSDQPKVHVHCAQSGNLVSCVEMYPGRQNNSLFIQSLRGDPHHCSRLSVLVNYKDGCYPLEIVHVDLGIHYESIIEKEPFGVRMDLGGVRTQDILAIAAPPLSDSVEVVRVEEEENKGDYGLHSMSSNQLALDLWGDGSTPFADCVIVCGDGTELKAHMGLLSIRCPVLFETCKLGDHCNETNLKRYQLPVPQAQELDHPFCEESRWPPSQLHHHTSRYSKSSSGNNTSTSAPIQAFPPESVHSTVMQIVLRYLYTDELHEESAIELAKGIEVGEKFDYLLALSPEDADRIRLITIYERIYSASNTLKLGRLASLIEVKCRDIIDVVSAIQLVIFASQLGASQLFSYCISFISAHLEVILLLHGHESLPSGLLQEIQPLHEMSTYQIDSCDSCAMEGGLSTEVRRPIPLTVLNSISSYSGSVTSIPLQGQTLKVKSDFDCDKIEPHLPMPIIHTHLDHLSRRHPSKNRILIRSLMTTLHGRSCTAMFSQGGSLMVLGSSARTGNRNFINTKNVLMLEGIGSALESALSILNNPSECCTEAVWVKHSSRGSSPPSLSYHSATPLEPYGQYRRWIFVFGGSVNIMEIFKHGEPSKTLSWMLDVLTMTWICVNPKGDVPLHRTRHSMVAMYPTPHDGEGGSLSSECSSFTYSSSKITPYAQLILFGGYNSTKSHAFNDIYLLQVTHKGSNIEPPKDINLTHSMVSSSQSFNFVWLRPEVTGSPPSPRLAHAACMVKNRFMVVVGGMGLGSIFQDVHVLNIHSQSRLEWERVDTKGAPPLPRYDHSLIAMKDNEGFPAKPNTDVTSTLVVYGGTNGRSIFTDLFVLKMVGIGNLERSIRWEMTWLMVEMRIPGSVVDVLHGNHKRTLCDIDGKLFIYGGAAKRNLVDAYSEEQCEDRDTNVSVHILFPDFTTYKNVIFQSDDGSLAVTRKVLYWALKKLCTAAVVPAIEYPVLVKPSSFQSDLKRLFSSGIFSDVLLSSDSEVGAETPLSFPAHRFIISSRCISLRAMYRSGMKEMDSEHVFLSDISSSTLKALLTYLYTDTMNLRYSEGMDLLITARKYMLDRLEALCIGKLQMMFFSKSFSDLSISVKLFQYSVIFKLNGLRGVVLPFLFRKWDDIRLCDEFQKFDFKSWRAMHRSRLHVRHIYMFDAPFHEYHNIYLKNLI